MTFIAPDQPRKGRTMTFYEEVTLATIESARTHRSVKIDRLEP
jgi:hypothetical protein